MALHLFCKRNQNLKKKALLMIEDKCNLFTVEKKKITIKYKA